MPHPLALLQQLSSAADISAPDPLEEDPSGNTPIVVPGVLSDPSQEDPALYDDNYNLGNGRAVIERDRAFEDTEGAVDPARADRRGPFGAQGTLRDILGTIGDAFLVQSGNERIYAPRREQERMSDAMAGFTQDPMAAIERMAGINPAVAQAMLEQFQLNQDRTTDNERMQGQAQVEVGRERRIAIGEARDNAARLLNAAAMSENPSAAFAEVVPQIQQMARNFNLSMDDIALQANMTPAQLAMYAQAGMTPYQQQRIPQLQYGLDTGRMNAGTNSARQRETVRSNTAREAQAAANEAGKEDRALLTDRRIRDLDGGGGGGSTPRVLRGSNTPPQAPFGRPRTQ